MFVNGRFEANVTTAKNFPASPNTESFARMWSGAAADYYAAKFNFVYAYNRALSAAEIAQLYREPFAMFDTYPVWWFYIFGEGGEGAGGQMIFGGQRILDGGVVR
jgi:hypothetical protein